MNIDSIITEWTYRLPKGYPTTEQDYYILYDVLQEMTEFTTEEQDQIVNRARGFNNIITEDTAVDDLADLFSSIQGLPKTGQFEVLSKYTAEHYQDKLGNIYKLFPQGINVIDNYTDYVDPKGYKTGEDKEVAIVNWAIQNNVPGEHIPGSTGKGVDIILDGKPIEVKSAKDKINTMLQTSFFKNDPEKFYIFAISQGSVSLKLLIVSSQLLYRLSLGEDIYQKLGNNEQSEKLIQQIKSGLEQVDFASQITSAIVSGEAPEGVTKSFYIGKNVKIRFLVFVEPTGLFDKEY
tara:strand:- start:1200 stop:2075 length:876 start_codon:yes stop_codon:yes gene_type:complete